MKIVNDLGDCGVLSCSITGGEPLVRPDFWEIIDALRDRDIGIIQIYSNGLAVNEDLLDGFERRGLRPEFNMSFDGVGHHDWLRGQPGAEKAVRRAFELCRDRGFPTGAEMCLWKENAHTLRESINYLASVGCRSIKTNPVADTGAWREGGYADKHDLSLDETLEIYLNYLDDFYRDLPPMFLHLGGFIAADGLLPDVYTLPVVHVAKDPDNVCMCAHARMSMYISAEGRAMTCMPISNNDEFMADYPRIQELGLRKCLTDSKYMELINTRAADVRRQKDGHTLVGHHFLRQVEHAQPLPDRDRIQLDELVPERLRGLQGHIIGLVVLLGGEAGLLQTAVGPEHQQALGHVDTQQDCDNDDITVLFHIL